MAGRYQTRRSFAIGLITGSVLSSIASADVPATPTFTRDIAPIFQSKCEACHRPDSIAPMSLRTYDEVRPWARAIRARVEARQMPPWHIDKTVGIQEFKNDRSLTDDQIATIVNWVDQGAPQGDPKDMPPAKVWPNDQGWNYAAMFGQKEPDLIIRSTAVDAEGGHQRHLVETGRRDRRHRAALGARDRGAAGHGQGPQDHPSCQCRTSTRRARRADAGQPSGRFMEWAVGKEGELMRPNSGKLLLPGSRIAWDIHYSRADEDITDVVEMGIYFYPKGQEPKYRQQPATDGKHGRQRHRHPAEHDQGDRELLRAPPGRSHRELPAAHASARQGDVDGGDPAERPDAGAEPRRQLHLQLA